MTEPSKAANRRDKLIEERVHDTYKLKQKLSEPTLCPECGAVYHNGRWTWAEEPPQDAEKVVCSACHRAKDNYPAGEVTLTGDLLQQNKEEIIRLVRNLETTENSEHPLNRIIAIRDIDDSVLITTTDVHLPRRIGKAIQKAFHGKLDIHFDKAGYFTSITWESDS